MWMAPKSEWRKGARDVGPGKRDPRLPPFCLSVPGRRRRSFREFCAVLDDSDGAGRAGGNPEVGATPFPLAMRRRETDPNMVVNRV